MALIIKGKLQNKCAICGGDCQVGFVCNQCRDRMMGKPVPAAKKKG